MYVKCLAGFELLGNPWSGYFHSHPKCLIYKTILKSLLEGETWMWSCMDRLYSHKKIAIWMLVIVIPRNSSVAWMLHLSTSFLFLFIEIPCI